ncbi:MAG: ethanolamine ammonia-lyase subunit EutC [Fimbriimonas sp.]
MSLEPFDALRKATPARIGLGRAGAAQSTRDQLRFEMDQARARDAVHRPFDMASLIKAIGIPCEVVQSQAHSVGDHLRRPDLGRRADPEDLALLTGTAPLLFVVSDGLSSGATERYVPRLLAALPERPRIVIVPYGRVAIGDEIGEALAAEIVVVLLGERPGLTDPESLGAYITYEPRRGRTDADRLCLSNIRDEGMPPEAAAVRLSRIIATARQVKGTGVNFPADSRPVLE